MNIAVEFNDRAIEYINAENFSDASVMFQGALQVFIMWTRDEGIRMEETRIKAASDKLRQRSSVRSSPSDPSNSRIPYNLESSFYSNFMYKIPLKITSETEGLLSSCVLLFNMGLINQMNAHQCELPSTKERYLQMAQKLYEMSYQVISDNNKNFLNEDDDNGGDDNNNNVDDSYSSIAINRQKVGYLELELGLINNMALIAHEKGKYEKAQHFQDELYRLVLSVDERYFLRRNHTSLHGNGIWGDQQQHEQNSNRVKSGDQNFFLLNSLLIRKPLIAAAA